MLIQSSAHDSYEVEDKIAQWLGAGVRLVWVLYPEMQHVAVPPPRPFRTPTHGWQDRCDAQPLCLAYELVLDSVVGDCRIGLHRHFL
jgi:hypothetical protein